MKDQTDQEILDLAHKRFRIAADGESRIREAALDDWRFRAGEQWPEEVKRQRELDRRPCLTINRLPAFLRQVTNEQRQNRPSIQVDPVDDHGDVKTAEIEQGLIRHIETSSNADVAYDSAFEHMATGGFGYIRVITDYCDDESFDQEILIKRVKNPFSVYYDPHVQEADGSDARYCFVVDDVPLEEFKAEHPDSELAGWETYSALGDRGITDWISEETIRIAEYMYVDTKERTLCLMPDGQKLFEDEYPGAKEHAVKTRSVRQRTVNWCMINAVEILEKKSWPGKWIPVVPVFGDELIINGERQLISMIRYAKDPQRMYNYWSSAETETIALAPRTPFVGVEGQFEGHEEKWRDANNRNFPYLEYKAKSVGGQFAPPPQRQQFEPPIQAISMARMQAADDLKATTGIFDASLGAQGNETSGRAILARQKEGDVANFHLVDNLSRAMKHLGRIVLQLIPKVYDSARVIRIIGTDQEQKTVRINQPSGETGDDGVEKIYDLTVGKYDVSISVGPSFNSKRQEAAESMMQLTQSYPALMQVAGDLMVKNMDWPGADKIAERLKMLLPPEIRQQEEQAGKPQQQISPQLLQQFVAQNEQLTSALADAQKMLEGKVLELQSRERIESMKIEADLIKTQAQLGQKDAITQLQYELQQINQWQSRIDTQQQQYLQHMDSANQRAHESQMSAQNAQQSQQAQQAQMLMEPSSSASRQDISEAA